jgi:dTDP-4-amino-4,6-dideoxygalactose transaminase
VVWGGALVTNNKEIYEEAKKVLSQCGSHEWSVSDSVKKLLEFRYRKQTLGLISRLRETKRKAKRIFRTKKGESAEDLRSKFPETYYENIEKMSVLDAGILLPSL